MPPAAIPAASATAWFGHAGRLTRILAPFMNTIGSAHHVFVDFENVQAVDLSGIGGKPVDVTLLLGKMQRRLDVALVQQIREHATQVRLIEMNATGKNALDLAVAYHVGATAATDPGASFHIVSRDRDFEPLIGHLRQSGMKVFRHDAFSIQAILAQQKAAPAERRAPPKAAAPAERRASTKASAPPDKVAITADRLRRSTSNRPARKTTLLAHIKSQLRGQLGPTEADEILDGLVARGSIAIDPRGRVSYPMAP